MITEQILLLFELDPAPSDITPLAAVRMDPDSAQMESVDVPLLEMEYEASNPEPLAELSDMNETFIYPVDADTGLGKAEPL
jgi:hypothetical protein